MCVLSFFFSGIHLNSTSLTRLYDQRKIDENIYIHNYFKAWISEFCLKVDCTLHFLSWPFFSAIFNAFALLLFQHALKPKVWDKLGEFPTGPREANMLCVSALDDHHPKASWPFTSTKVFLLAKTLSLHFTRVQIFASHSHLQRVYATAAGNAYYRTRGKPGDNLHYLRFVLSSRQVDCACKNWQLWDLSVIIIFVISS